MLVSTYRKLRVRFGRRRFRAYGVGPGKSGTHSLANMFQPHYRTAHEPEANRVLELLVKYKAGRATENELSEYILDKDRRLGLEMDCAGYNAFLAGHLADRFPDAKFLLTVRDCFSWANSAINQVLNNPNVADHWSAWRSAVFGPIDGCKYDVAESILHQHHMWNLESIYRAWADHYRAVLDNLPRDRMLILRTTDLYWRYGEIADFLGISPDTLTTAGSRDFLTPHDFGLLAKIDPAFVTGRAQEVCGDIMRLLYPEVGCDYRVFCAMSFSPGSCRVRPRPD